MVFSSTVFLLAFLPLTLAAYFVIPQKYTAGRNIVLLTASLIFYAWGEPKYILLMLCSILCSWLLALEIQRRQMKNHQHGARAVLMVSVLLHLAALGFFKYTDFLLQTVNNLFHCGFLLPGIALPIGISFYTFQTLSYIIDVYRKEIPAQKNLIAFAMYVSLFPQLIAGPIVRYQDVNDKLCERPQNSAQIAEGIRRFIAGFAKKILLANQVCIIWEEISQAGTVSAAAAWLGAAAFTFQIYFDFSGYSDMAIGLGKIFGFDYPENFRYPYISQSITEFWRRWHISLGTWFREYVYIPLGGNRKGTVRQILNIAAVWALTGLWHGASWNFVFWGIYFAVLLIAEKLFMLRFLEKLPAALRHFYALFFIVCGWVIFALPAFSSVLQYFSMMAGKSGMLTDDIFFYFIRSRAVLLLICALFATPLPKKAAAAFRKSFENRPMLYGLCESGILLLVFCCSVAFLVSSAYNPFLYFRF